MMRRIFSKNDPQSDRPISLTVEGQQLNFTPFEASVAWQVIRDSLSAYFYAEVRPRLIGKYSAAPFNSDTLCDLREEMKEKGVDCYYPEVLNEIVQERERHRLDGPDKT